ncbi:dGTPase [Cedecea neteri]|uniref:dGTPase n=1 Tax=Cedecea neteri TaxID=158822 RepID=UPI000690D42E|nr:dGTPase [Cedecea neteri]
MNLLRNMISADKVDMRSKYDLEDAFLSDKGRLIYSAPFRRMQQKAQVFSLESNSAVRSRLSHSLEVAHIGAYITHAITKKIKSSSLQDNENNKFWIDNEKSINSIVETTCLMHDIGNPPFGHFGESTISEWFNNDKRILDILLKAEIVENETKELSNKIKEKLCLTDFTAFDGNPQAIRIATKLQGEDGLTGFNFTYTQIAASLEYTYGGSNYKKIDDNHLSSKIGYFSTEVDIIEDTWKSLHLPNNSRHPLTFIMEAADDISYCTSDIDDGIEKGVVKADELYNHLIKNIEIDSSNPNSEILKLIEIAKGNQQNKKISQFTEFKTTLSRLLVEKAANMFFDDLENIINLKRNCPLLVEEESSKDVIKVLCELKSFTREFIFSAPEVEMTELSGYSIITGILNCYAPILEIKNSDFQSLIQKKKNKSLSKVVSRLYRTLPDKYLKAYESEIKKHKDDNFKEWNLRAHLVIDFISGMTDQFALELYQSLTGIKVK